MKVFFAFLLSISVSIAQYSKQEVKSRYDSAFRVLEDMMSGRENINFKKAVWAVESAYLDDRLNSPLFDSAIQNLTIAVKSFKTHNQLLYSSRDKEKVATWASVFKVMTDTTEIPFGAVNLRFLPFTYDFEDFYGEKDWTKMFVSKLLDAGSGNCHSLPYLYKILAEELGVTAHLALAPNHIYIKHWNMKDGWYNTELTSAAFPIDAWIMVSGYVHLSAIENGVYMKALDDKESIALCLIDLAEGYKRKTNNQDLDFVLKCCDTALRYFPNYINALLLKAETLKSLFDKQKGGLKSDGSGHLKKKFEELQSLYAHIHELGYRQMPKDMYLKWLIELKTEKEKYSNKKIAGFDK